MPQAHFLRKIIEANHLMKIREVVERLYCEDNSRPSIGQVALFKVVLIQYIYGIHSLRRILGKATGRQQSSGFCTYPEYHFDAKRLKELDREGYERYAAGLQQRGRSAKSNSRAVR